MMIRNEYLDSLELLKKNKIVIDRLTRKLTLIERETSSIASELDAIETKISPMLSQHVPSYEVSISCDADDTTATCTSTTLSKTQSPDRDGAQREIETESVHRYINLSDFDGECLLGDMDSVSGLFSSDLSSISKCQSYEHVEVTHEKREEMEVFIKRDGWHSVDGSNVQELLKNRQGDDSYMISMRSDDESEVSGLSDIGRQEEDYKAAYLDDCVILGTVIATSDEGSVEVASEASATFAVKSPATYEETGQKSHLYSFPEDACCLFGEPSQDLTIPASAEEEEDAPCFILGIKSRDEEDECGCVIC